MLGMSTSMPVARLQKRPAPTAGLAMDIGTMVHQARLQVLHQQSIGHGLTARGNVGTDGPPCYVLVLFLRAMGRGLPMACRTSTLVLDGEADTGDAKR